MANLSNPRNDYDSPWKQVLELLFSDFMAFFFPHIHADTVSRWRFPHSNSAMAERATQHDVKQSGD